MTIAVVFDTENTDLLSSSPSNLKNQPHLIEFFGVKLELNDVGDWEEIDTLHVMVKPPIPISEEITKITNITQEMVEDCPPAILEFGTITNFFEGVDLAVAHNLSYDKSVLENEAQRNDWGWRLTAEPICTVEATEPIYGRRIKLGELYKNMTGEDLVDAHRAENDVRATVEVFRRLWRDGEI